MSPLVAFIDLLFGFALLLAPAAWIMDPVKLFVGPLHLSVGWGWKPIVAPLLLLMARRAVRMRHPARKGPLDAPVIRKLALAWTAVFVAFLIAEGMLSWLGYTARVAPIAIADDQGRQVDEGKAIVPDLELIWKFQPGAEFEGRRVNRLGFLDREVNEEKAAGTRRVICLGDSCTGQGTPPYSGYLHQFLREDPPAGGSWEAFNMGVHGYSVLQGRRLFELRTADLRPDVVTIYFGWNDHWLADRPDRIRMAVVRSGWRGRLLTALQEKRWYVLLLTGSHSLESHLRGAAPAVRVAPEEYEAALRDLCEEIRAAGAVPIVITAARATHLPRMLVQRKHAVSIEEAVRLHDEYVAITRRVAGETGSPMLDLAAELSGETAGEDVFMGDGIHFRQTGLETIGRAIHRRIKELYAAAPTG
jgi:lysophospholipase L1-like esterase